jgi:hypothetical protein
MTVNRADTEPATATDVRLCERCARPLPALEKNEYTAARAQMIATIGLCVCPLDPHTLAAIPKQAPSAL